MHKRNIVHRDIKLENIILGGDPSAHPPPPPTTTTTTHTHTHPNANPILKIIDFGFSITVPPDKKLQIFCGTPSYMAPEIVSKKEYYGPPVDVWSAGIVLYLMLVGHFPFKGTDDKHLYQKI